MTSPKDLSIADVVGVGLNATDTIIHLPYFPTLDTKVPILSTHLRAGGQAATAMVACQRWGLHARYVGKVGDDWAADFPFLRITVEHWRIRCRSTPAR